MSESIELTEDEQAFMLDRPMAYALYDGWRLRLMVGELEEMAEHLPPRLEVAFRLVAEQFGWLARVRGKSVQDFVMSQDNVHQIQRPEAIESYFELYLQQLEALRLSYDEEGEEGGPPYLRTLDDTEGLLKKTIDVLADFQRDLESFRKSLEGRTCR